MKRITSPKAIHICNSHKPPLRPKIAKEYVLPSHRENEIVANLKDKYKEMNECQQVTKAIRNLGVVENQQVYASK